MANSNVYTELTWSILGNEKVPLLSVGLAGCPVLYPPILSLLHLSKYCLQGRPQKCISFIKNASSAVLILHLWFYKCRQICLDPANQSCLTWPTIRGFLLSVTSYCRMSPCNQLLKYRKRSSSEIKISVMRPMAQKKKKNPWVTVSYIFDFLPL